MVASDSMIEITRGFGGSNYSEGISGNVVSSKFMSGTSGYGAYDEGGLGHFFAMENLSENQVSKLGIEQAIDINQRGDLGPAESLQYQATHYVDSATEKNIMRAGLPMDAKITSNNELLSQIDSLRAGEGPLADFRRGIAESGNAKALGMFDSFFNVNDELGTSAAAIMQKYDAAIVNERAYNEVRVFNRSSILSTPLKSTEEMDELYPRTPVGLKGSMVRGNYIESHADRRGFLTARLAKAQEGAQISQRRLPLKSNLAASISSEAPAARTAAELAGETVGRMAGPTRRTLGSSVEASAAVARGTKNSRALRAIGAAKTALKARF